MGFVSDREGKIVRETSLADSFLHVLYGHMPGRLLLRPLLCPVVSKMGGMFLDTGLSRIFIRPFVRRNGIVMADFEPVNYVSYNDFFKRKMNPGVRGIAREKDLFVSPCDGRLRVYKIDDACRFSVKDTQYTIESLLRNRKLADRFAGGYVWVFRLCVDDYHRYIYIDGGYASKPVKIPGIFHTVKPAATDHVAVYKENTREYCLLKSENFGAVLQMEVGALLVGKIENRPGNKRVQRGEEKGNFAFGGSTIIVLTQKGKVLPAGDILRNARQGIEVRVKLGECVGRKGKGF